MLKVRRFQVTEERIAMQPWQFLCAFAFTGARTAPVIFLAENLRGKCPARVLGIDYNTQAWRQLKQGTSQSYTIGGFKVQIGEHKIALPLRVLFKLPHPTPFHQSNNAGPISGLPTETT